jgi:hypothetical protein
MAANTVEATLSSRYVDGVSQAFTKTGQFLQSAMNTTAAAASSFSGTVASAFDATMGRFNQWRNHFKQMSEESDSFWKKMSWGAAATALGIAGAVAMAAKAVGGWLLQISKEASELTELKLAYEGLSQAVGWHSETLKNLKQVTEGLVSSMELTRNANRIMQSGVAVTDALYVELTQNVFRLAKSARVDGSQAMNTLTDALIKGNTRGFQSIGIHLNVKDAISEMAAAAGQSAKSMESSGKMQAFYAELLEQTRAAVAKLPADFVSLEDALTRAEKSWHAMFLAVGEGVNRSAALQAVLQKFSTFLDGFGAKGQDIDNIARATNAFVVSTLKVLGALAQGFAVTWPIVNFFIQACRSGFNALQVAFLLVGTTISAVLQGIAQAIDMLTGGRIPGLRQAVDYLAKTTTSMATVLREKLNETFSVWKDGWGASGGAMQFGEWASKTAAELAKLNGEVIRGKSTLQAHGESARGAAVDQAKLNDQVKLFAELQRELSKRLATPEQQAISLWAEQLAKIEQLTLISEEKKNALREAAFKSWVRRMLELQQEANNKAYEQWKELQMLVGLGTMDVKDIPRPYQPPQPKNLGDDPAYRSGREGDLRRMEELIRLQEALRKSNERNTPNWAKPLSEAHLELQKLNELGMDPFHQTMAAMKNSVIDFAGQAGQAFANFFADLVSGQAGAGKKLLAAFLGMIGQMIVKVGVMLIQVGIAEIALAQTFVGRMMGASTAAGVKALITGAVLAAAGGVLMGAAANMAQTNQAGAAGNTFQSSVPRPLSSGQTQVIQVGAPGRSQDLGGASAATVKHEVTLKLDTGGIVKVVKQNIQGNGELRLVVANAT